MQTYSTLLTQLMQSSDMNLKATYEMVKNTGASISYPSLASYKSFSAVPGFERAKAILNAFNYPIKDSDLMDCLAYSREVLNDLRSNSKSYIQQGVRINPSKIKEDLSIDMLNRVVSERIQELFGSDGNFSSYVSYLIKKDLIENKYLEEN